MADGTMLRNESVQNAGVTTPEPTVDAPPSPRRRWPWALAVVLGVALVVGWVLFSGGEGGDAGDEAAELRFAEVTRTDLEEVTTLDGTLGRGEGDDITAAVGGIVTAAPEPGETIVTGEVLYEIDAEPVVLLTGSSPAYRDVTLSEDTLQVVARAPGTVTGVVEAGTLVEQGDVIYEIDGRPVVALYGDVPAFRTLADLSENITGADVQQLETALDALGYNTGDVTVDDEFTDFTEQMVEDWQEAVGLEVDGSVDLGEIVFIPGPTEVLTVDAAVGDLVSDGRAVLSLAGDEPMAGVDVEQLEASLLALGHDPGEVDGLFTADTREAVLEWQAATGMEVDGVVNLGEVVFRSGPVRVATQATPPGSPVNAGGPVLGVTSSEIVVTADLPAEDQGILAVGDAVAVELPDGTEVPGTVTEVATVATRDATGNTVFEVTIALDDPAAAGDLDEAPVEVSVVTDSVTDVVAVPVTALLALREGGYAVEVQNPDGTTSLVGVEPGFFADGLVELVNPSIQPGEMVVVP